MQIGGGWTGLGATAEEVDVGDAAMEGKCVTPGLWLWLVNVHGAVSLPVPSILRVAPVFAYRTLPRPTGDG